MQIYGSKCTPSPTLRPYLHVWPADGGFAVIFSSGCTNKQLAVASYIRNCWQLAHIGSARVYSRRQNPHSPRSCSQMQTAMNNFVCQSVMDHGQNAHQITLTTLSPSDFIALNMTWDRCVMKV